MNGSEIVASIIAFIGGVVTNYFLYKNKKTDTYAKYADNSFEREQELSDKLERLLNENAELRANNLILQDKVDYLTRKLDRLTNLIEKLDGKLIED